MPCNKEKLKEVFLKIFQNINHEDFDFGKERSEFENWDSLAHMQLVSEIEDIFKVSFEMDEVAVVNRPEDFLSLIDKKQNV